MVLWWYWKSGSGTAGYHIPFKWDCLVGDVDFVVRPRDAGDKQKSFWLYGVGYYNSGMEFGFVCAIPQVLASLWVKRS